MSTDALRPTVATEDRATAWLGSNLHVKGEISGNEDLLIDGAVEGLVQLHKWKLTVGTTAKLTADINARDVVVYGDVKGNPVILEPVRGTHNALHARSRSSIFGHLCRNP